MNRISTRIHTYAATLLLLLTLLTTSGEVGAQLILERELIGAVATVSSAEGGDGAELRTDASFGEPMIGFTAGDLIATIGFHQPSVSIDARPTDEEDQLEGNLVGIPTVVSVRSYPNPVTERLMVDLAEHQYEFTQLRMIDLSGRTVKIQQVADQQLVIFSQLDDLTTAYYHLQGLDKRGKTHQLGRIMIITH